MAKIEYDKTVSPLTETDTNELNRIVIEELDPRTRTQAEAILLSSRDYSISDYLTNLITVSAG